MVIIANGPFSPEKKLAAFLDVCGDAGGVATFVGRVRSENESIRELYLEHYPGMTERKITAMVEKAKKRWTLTNALIIHRIGKMKPGDSIVMVVTAAAHRRDAFEACDFLMDYLKTDAVFWKKQTGPGDSAWIEPRAQDYQDRKRWG